MTRHVRASISVFMRERERGGGGGEGKRGRPGGGVDEGADSEKKRRTEWKDTEL